MSMLATLYGLKPQDLERLSGNETAIRNFFDSCEDTCDLQKRWHGLHYLLTGTGESADLPLGFIQGGWNTLDGSDFGYGEASYLTGPEVVALSEALAGITKTELRRRYRPGEMEEKEIYPDIWTRPEEIENNFLWLSDMFVEMRIFVDSLAKRRKSMLVHLS